MPLTLRDITWASLSETRNHRDKIAVSVSERRTYVLANADGSLKLASHIFRSPVAVTLVENGGDALPLFHPLYRWAEVPEWKCSFATPPTRKSCE